MGKKEIHINGPRVIDIDILLFDNLIYKSHFLQIPHIQMCNRDFVLVPLSSIAGEWIHPKLGKTISQLCNEIPTDNIISQIDHYKDEI